MYIISAPWQAWNLTGDGSIKEFGGKTWISEMYGYSFAAASAGVWHRQLDYAANVVPGMGPIGGTSSL
jgi:NET1-associated nuclear protein 1 (U3 small nucleolar RNA-associated protein 17)